MIVGPAGASEEESALLEYSRDRSFAKPMKPRLAVKGKNASEAQALVELPQPLVTAYRCKVREMVHPKRPCGSYYRALTPSKIGA